MPGDEKEKKKRKRDERRLERRLKRSKVNVCVEMEQSQEQIEQEAQEQVLCDQDDVNKDNDESEISISEPQEESVESVQNVMLDEMQNHVNEAEDQQPSENLQFPFEQFIKPASPEPLIRDIGVQVNTVSSVPSIIKCIQSDSQLSTVTGIESFQLLDTIVEIVKKVSNNKFEHYNVILNTRDRVIMTYMKLKQNLSYSFLAVCFCCYTSKHCQRIFHDTIKVLSKCLKAAIPWPSKEEISKNLPKCFEGFESVRVVLDCTEIFIQHPANLCCQVLTYSHYKGGNTFKVMTGVSPSGNITYVSKPYGGRVTDSTIFQQSSLIKLLEPGDGVMVDRGFLIDEVCEKNEWKCIRPPFLREKKQFTKEESLLTAKIATARVHIERSNQRIKTFKVLGSVLPSTLMPLIEDIFIVICGTINMSAPILSDSKFMNVE